MTMTDTILFVKETQTCHYVLHIATPRLCGEPGFRSIEGIREYLYSTGDQRTDGLRFQRNNVALFNDG